VRMARYALITLTSDQPVSVEPATITDGDVFLIVRTADEHSSPGRLLLLVTAQISINPELFAGGKILAIPSAPRLRCEEAILRIADLYSVCTHAARSIASPTPAVPFVPEDDWEHRLLHDAVFSPLSLPTYTHLHTAVDPSTAAQFFADRWEGVALLAEANSQERLAAKYRELVRFYEAAYRLSFVDQQMAKKLHQSLPNVMGYSRAEIRSWQALRHPFSHADGKETLELAFEGDARPVVQRMEQAAWYLLFNKNTWNDPSRLTRQAILPAAYTTSPDGGGNIRQNATVHVQFLVLDPFGAFPHSAYVVTPPDDSVVPLPIRTPATATPMQLPSRADPANGGGLPR